MTHTLVASCTAEQARAEYGVFACYCGAPAFGTVAACQVCEQEAALARKNITPQRVRNLTPHVVNLSGMAIEPEPISARVTMTRETVAEVTILRTVGIDGWEQVTVPVHRAVIGAVTGLPDRDSGTILIVSRVVADAVPDRDDVFVVDDTVRDKQGRIVGAYALARP